MRFYDIRCFNIQIRFFFSSSSLGSLPFLYHHSFLATPWSSPSLLLPTGTTGTTATTVCDCMHHSPHTGLSSCPGLYLPPLVCDSDSASAIIPWRLRHRPPSFHLMIVLVWDLQEPSSSHNVLRVVNLTPYWFCWSQNMSFLVVTQFTTVAESDKSCWWEHYVKGYWSFFTLGSYLAC